MFRLPKGRAFVLLTSGVGLGYGIAAYRTKRTNSVHPSLDEQSFTPWKLVRKDAVSSTSKMFELSPPQMRTTPGDRGPLTSPYDALFKAGTWSVQIKQPQLQIAREYTPLPPPLDAQRRALDKSSAETDRLKDLRLLIRRDGEVSKYVDALPEGSDLEIRGPQQQSPAKWYGKEPAQEIVFLAGGTGIAPAMQMAHGVLLAEDSRVRGAATTEGAVTDRTEDAGPATRMAILWASRKREDCLDGQSDAALISSGAAGCRSAPLSSWIRALFFAHPDPDYTPSLGAPSSATVGPTGRTTTTNPIVTQLRDTQAAFARIRSTGEGSGNGRPGLPARECDAAVRQAVSPRLEVGYFVDEEKSFITPAHIRHVLTRPSIRHPVSVEDNQVQGGDETSTPRKLIVVSGPEGFVKHFAGPKQFRDGREVQGPVGGILGQLGREGLLEGWDIYKL